MSDYKLSHTAQEIDAKLKRIEEGGTGYTDGETVHPIDPKYLLKVIDLAKYEVDATPAGMSLSTTLNGVVLSLFSNGGGSGTVTDNSSFWNDVNTNSPLSFAIDASDISPGITITADVNSITAGNGVPYAIEFSFLVQVQAWGKVTVVFGNNFNGTTQITVIAEPLTITGA